MQADVMNTLTQAIVSAVGQTNTVLPQIRLVPCAYVYLCSARRVSFHIKFKLIN